MISIINMDGDPLGECTYTLSINSSVITTFKHDRTEGLAQCLRDAADSVDLKKSIRRDKILKAVKVIRSSNYKEHLPLK